MSGFLGLTGRVSIVTGAARGIGLATAIELAGCGSDVALLDLDFAETAARATEVAREHNVRAKAYALDVRDVANVAATIDRLAAEFGAVDHVVNNAGIQHVAPIAEFPTERWDAVIATNLNAVFHVTRAAWPHLVARKRGRIVNIASVHGLVASEFKPAYVAAKHGVVGLTRAAALEGAAHGITVNAVCPGAVLTELVRNQAKSLVAAYGGGITEDEALARAFLTAMPTNTFIEPREVAQLCAYLCSDAARSITGAPIAIDGGWSAH